MPNKKLTDWTLLLRSLKQLPKCIATTLWQLRRYRCTWQNRQSSGYCQKLILLWNATSSGRFAFRVEQYFSRLQKRDQQIVLYLSIHLRIRYPKKGKGQERVRVRPFTTCILLYNGSQDKVSKKLCWPLYVTFRAEMLLVYSSNNTALRISYFKITRLLPATKYRCSMALHNRAEWTTFLVSNIWRFTSLRYTLILNRISMASPS